MLNAQQAQEKLRTFAMPEAEARRQAALRELEPPLAKLACRYLGRALDGRVLSQMTDAEQEAFRRDCAEAETIRRTLLPEQHARVLDALVGGLSKLLQYCWTTQRTQWPLEWCWGGVAYRSPGNPDLANASFDQWVGFVISDCPVTYPTDIEWLADWSVAACGTVRPDVCARLLAVAMGHPEHGARVSESIVSAVEGRNEIARLSEVHIRTLLQSPNPDHWKLISKLLNDAGREEGLRKSIFESLDKGCVESMLYMFQFVLDHNVPPPEAFNKDWWKQRLDSMRVMLEHWKNRPQWRQWISEAADWRVTSGLSGEAHLDLQAAIALARPLVDEENLVRKHQALRWLKSAPGAVIIPQRAWFTHPDPVFAKWTRVTYGCFEAGLRDQWEEWIAECKVKSEPIIMPWYGKLTLEEAKGQDAIVEYGKAPMAYAFLRNWGDDPYDRVIPYLSLYDDYSRGSFAADKLASRADRWTTAERACFASLVGDRANWTRQQALKALAKIAPTPEILQALEGQFSKKTADLRRALLTYFSAAPAKMATASAQRLCKAKDAQMKAAGLELLRLLKEKGAGAADALDAAAAAGLGAPGPGHVAVLPEKSPKYPRVRALGLFEESDRIHAPPPVERKVVIASEASRHCLAALSQFMHERRERAAGGPDAPLIGADYFPYPTGNYQPGQYPVVDELLAWSAARPAELRDPDGLEWVRVLRLLAEDRFGTPSLQEIKERLFGDVKLNTPVYHMACFAAIRWFFDRQPLQMGMPAIMDYMLDVLETTLAHLQELIGELKDDQARAEPYAELPMRWRSVQFEVLCHYLTVPYQDNRTRFDCLTDAQQKRLFDLERHADEQYCRYARRTGMIALEDFLLFHGKGLTNDADLLPLLLPDQPDPSAGANPGGNYANTGQLGGESALHPTPLQRQYPILRTLVDKIRQRVLEIELQRGDAVTVATYAALALRYSGGMDLLMKLLATTSEDTLVRGYQRDAISKDNVFSHLIRTTFPGEGDTPAAFKAHVAPLNLSETRLLQIAFFAPQWTAHAAAGLGWSGLEDALWWLHAHTKDNNSWVVPQEVKDKWTVEIGKRTPLTPDDLWEGAVDVAWFTRAYKSVSPQQWKLLYNAAKFACGGIGHKRAQLFADAMLGQTGKKELIAAISKSRHQDSVRALGLIPLDGGKTRDADILERYALMQDYLRGGRAFGSQKQASERRAVEIGMDNLSRTADFPDPIRLQWAMEALQCRDLAKGPVQAKVGEAIISLAIDKHGLPEITAEKKGKKLASIPADAKKDAGVVELQERKTTLRKSAARLKNSLEAMMCRGDTFAAAELQGLWDHPLLRPMLEKVVLVDEAGNLAGYPCQGGARLHAPDGMEREIESKGALRIAHPVDLLAMGDWDTWQAECVSAQRVQPFKQVFRELYLPTPEETNQRTSSRYQGRVRADQAMALLGPRGWVNDPEAGVFKTLHAEGLLTWLEFDTVFQSARDAGDIKVEFVRFQKLGDPKREEIPLGNIPPRVFSEVMRDVDLIVSVAAASGSTPEASMSTVEFRRMLLEQLLKWMKIGNVRFKDRYALIDGKLFTYSLHLGSATVQRLPGGSVVILPMSTEGRGRVFLPFADDDPATAEVIAKTLLLARDDQIKDPTILGQLRG